MLPRLTHTSARNVPTDGYVFPRSSLTSHPSGFCVSIRTPLVGVLVGMKRFFGAWSLTALVGLLGGGCAVEELEPPGQDMTEINKLGPLQPPKPDPTNVYGDDPNA